MESVAPEHFLLVGFSHIGFGAIFSRIQSLWSIFFPSILLLGIGAFSSGIQYVLNIFPSKILSFGIRSILFKGSVVWNVFPLDSGALERFHTIIAF